MNILKDKINSELKIKRSKFITNIKPVNSLKEAKDFINTISKENKNANHNCWVYRLGDQGEIFHYSDNGEPSGTAGLPMFRLLQKYDLTNVVAVVTRYFGGIKLGIRGLIEAYGESIRQTLQKAELTSLVRYNFLTISTSYHYSETLKYKLNKMGVIFENTEYSGNVIIKIKFVDNSNTITNFLQSQQNSGKLLIK